MKSVLERLKTERLYWDGGTGAVLQARGLKPGELSERWNLEHPDEIERLEMEYLEAGANILTTNTFSLNDLRFPGEVQMIAEKAVGIAKAARTKAGREDALIALDMGPTGKLIEPLGDLKFDRAVELYGELAAAGEKAGADLILIETMSDTYEAKAAVLGAKEHCSLPIVASFTYDGSGKLLTGADPAAVIAIFEGLGVSVIGMNCGLGPVEAFPLVEKYVENKQGLF